MDTEAPGKKPKGRAAAARKKPVALTEISEDDEDGKDQSDDDDFEVEVVEAPPAGKKKGGGRKPAAAATAKAAAAKPPAAAKKRGAAAKQAPAGQKLITDVLKQSENAMEISPEKKVRRMRPSPFNKKSGSVLGKDGKKGVEVMSGLDEESPESSEAAFVAPARPQRANRGKVAYVPSDSDSEAPTEDSDFEVEDVASD